MELASVRALKLECKSRVRELWQDNSSRRALGVRAQGIGRSVRPKTIAVGILTSEKSDYKLALRVQNPLLVHGKEVETMREMAKGEVDVRFIGSVRKLQGTPFQGRIRPLRIGFSVGHVQVTAGTLGAFVQDTSQTMILSNNHVLANENNANPGDDVLQPGRFDGGTDPADAVATLTRFIPLDFTNPNVVDCAVAGVMNGVQFDAANLDALGQLAGVRTTPLGMNEPVAKIGRTTGVTQGVVIAVELDNVSVGYDAGDAVFDNQIEIQTSGGGPFSQGGDSGSLIVDGNQQAIALLFAGSDTGGPNNLGLTYANPIDAVFQALSVTLVI
jgi:hypothetical protein